MDEKNLELPVNEERLRDFDKILLKYKAGKHSVERRVVAAEQWWKLRNETEERKQGLGWDDSFRAKSGWLHNVIVSKHADAMESYPEPIVLPREPGDKETAKTLSSVIPVVLEQTRFEKTYSDVAWQKLKTGTGVYQVTWDDTLLNGLGDISIRKVDLLSLFWEPGVSDIQKSRYFFHCELQDNELLEEEYPELKDKLKGQRMTLTRFVYDDTVPTDGKSLVVDVYYKHREGGKTILHYCKYVNDVVLKSTENDAFGTDTMPEEGMAQGSLETMQEGVVFPTQLPQQQVEVEHFGLYDHGMYPFVFDPLWPVEGSPCGYGYVDLCMNSQIQLDMLDTAFLKNAMVGATPRYFERVDGAINEKEFLDINKPIVHVQGSTLDDTGIRPIQYNPLAGNYINFYQNKVAELRETSGNTETANGIPTAGVTAASAFAALQEASGKTSRDSSRSSYRSFRDITEMIIELVRQFWTLPRTFRITGMSGQTEFQTVDNSGLQPQWLGMVGGEDMGYRLPVFDIKIEVQKRNAYTRTSQNELALQMYQLMFFEPRNAVPALACVDMMDFEGKEDIVQKLQMNGSLQQQLQQVMQLLIAMAQKYEPNNVDNLVQNLTATAGPMISGGGEPVELNADSGENGQVTRARERANQAANPE